MLPRNTDGIVTTGYCIEVTMYTTPSAVEGTRTLLALYG